VSLFYDAVFSRRIGHVYESFKTEPAVARDSRGRGVLLKNFKLKNCMILNVQWKPRLPLNGAFGTQEEKKVSEFDKYVQMAKDPKMIKAYQIILLVHSHDARELSQAVLEIEKASFLDGHYFSFAVRYCKLCKICSIDQGKPCPTPEKVRPCDQSFGIDVYKTARNQELPCDVLQKEKDVQNRYGFVLIQ